MNLREVVLQPVAASAEARFQALMDAHHYLGALPKIGHTLWYVATWHPWLSPHPGRLQRRAHGP